MHMLIQPRENTIEFNLGTSRARSQLLGRLCQKTKFFRIWLGLGRRGGDSRRVYEQSHEFQQQIFRLQRVAGFTVLLDRIVVEARGGDVSRGVDGLMDEDVREGGHDGFHDGKHVVDEECVKSRVVSSPSPDPLNVLQQVAISCIESKGKLLRKRNPVSSREESLGVTCCLPCMQNPQVYRVLYNPLSWGSS